MISDTYDDPNIVDVELNRTQYYDVFMTLLRAGHVANITMENPFTYGSITPPQLSLSFRRGMFDELIFQRPRSHTPREIYANRPHSEIVRSTRSELNPEDIFSDHLLGSKDKRSVVRASPQFGMKKTSQFNTIEINKREEIKMKRNSGDYGKHSSRNSPVPGSRDSPKMSSKLSARFSPRIEREKKDSQIGQNKLNSFSSDNLVSIDVPFKKVQPKQLGQTHHSVLSNELNDLSPSNFHRPEKSDKMKMATIQ